MERHDQYFRDYSSVDESVASRLAGEILTLTARGLIRRLRSPVGARRYLSKPDRPRVIDRYINYFGDSPGHSGPPSSASVHTYAAV